jgi:hypothetical protein
MSVIDIAKKYLGKTEKPGNMGFNDAEFEKKMIAVGFQKTHAWCAYFMELVFKEAFPQKFAVLDKLFSASVMTTYHNFKTAGYTISTVPKAGTLTVFQTYKGGKPQATGHICLCISGDKDSTFQTIDGNTDDIGGREGYIVAIKSRNYYKVQNIMTGLRLIGFIDTESK